MKDGAVYLSFDEDLKLVRYITRVEEDFLDSVWYNKGNSTNIRTVFYMKDRYFKKDWEMTDGSTMPTHIHLVSIHDAYRLGAEDRRKAQIDIITNPEINPDEDDRFEISSCSLGFPVKKNDVPRMVELSLERWKYFDPSEGAKNIKNNYKALELFLSTNDFKETETYIGKCFVVDVQIPETDRWYTIRGTKRYATNIDSPVSRQRMDLKHPTCSLGVVQAESTGNDPNDEIAKKDSEYIFKKHLGLFGVDFDNICTEPFEL